MKQLMFVLLTAALIWAGGCACLQGQPEPAPAPQPKPAAAPAPAPAPVAMAANHVVRMYDCSCCAALKIEKLLPEKVQLNQPFDYTITVTNLTDMELANVVVKENLPAGFKYKSSTPAGKLDGNTLVWMMSTLGPKAMEKIVVSGSASEVGWLQTCADATYVIPACAKTQVVQPALAVSKVAPEKVTLCDPITLQYTVSNKGTGAATNVKLVDKLPEGLKTADGKSVIELALGTIAAGQSVSRTVAVKAEKTGTFASAAAVSADGDLKADSQQPPTKVVQPVLAIEKNCPKTQYLGRTVSYEVIVANKGDAAAVDTVVTDTLPANVADVVVSDGGVVAGGKITWNLGVLAAGASKKMTVTYKPTAAGDIKGVARATATCAAAVEAACGTQVAGIPAVLLEVIDVDDPIEVGKNETYIITVTNQGSAPDTNIKIKAILEDEMEFVSAGGATAGTFANGEVVFQPLASLAPGAKASWRVVVKAVKPGDVRLKVVMFTEELKREVMETEATRFYE